MDDTNLRAILEGTSDGIFAVETSGRFAYVNASAADLIGITPTSVPPELWAETFGLFLPDEITLMPQAQLPFALAMKGESIHDLAMFVRNDHVASGRHLCATVRPWRNRSSVVVGGIVTVRDSTAHVIAEREARKVSRFLESIIEHVPAMIFVKEATELRFERFNRAGEELLGMSRDRLLGKNDYDFFPKEQADFFTAHDRETLQGTDILDIPEEPIQTGRGERWLHTQKVPIHDDAGEPKYLLGISLDITTRKLAEDELRRTHAEMEQRVSDRTADLLSTNVELHQQIEDRFKTEHLLRESEAAFRAQADKLQVILDSLEEGVMIVSLDGRYELLNQAARRISGPSLHDIERLPNAKLHTLQFHGDGITPMLPHERPTARALLGETIEDMPIVIQEKGVVDTVLLRVSARPLRKENNEIYAVVLTMRDATENRRLEQLREHSLKLEEQNRSVLQASRLKSEFLANMSHELRTPLNAVIGFATLLHAGQVPYGSPEFNEFLGDIVASGWRLLQLINDVLDLAKVEAGKLDFHPEDVDVRQAVAEVLHLLRANAAERQISLHSELDPQLLVVQTDPVRLGQILNNYLSNALKFTPQGGKITVKMLASGDTAFRIEVIDTGIGIAQEDMNRLFVEFQQLEAGEAKRHGGTGLGLALTRRLVEAQGGSVGVESVLGQGSTFYAVLPRLARLGQPLPEMRAILANAVNAPWALVVEDDVRDQNMLVDTLSRAGWSVQTAATAAQAIHRTQERVFQAITLDLLLPDGSGLDVLAAVRRDAGPNQHTPVVVVSVVSQPSDSEHAVAATIRAYAVQDWLPKPISPDALLLALTAILPQSIATGTGSVLVIDDDNQSLRLMEATLGQLGISALCRQDAQTALQDLHHLSLDAVVLDLLMPGMDGFTFLEQFRKLPLYRQVPVLIWTSKDLTAGERQRLARSAQAIVTKGNGTALVAELRRVLGASIVAGP